jgi:uncharacterized membrane protein
LSSPLVQHKFNLGFIKFNLNKRGGEKMKKLLVRLSNKKVLLSVISGILLILVQLNVINVEMSHNVDVVVNTVLSVLVAVGVVSDPESHLKK